MRCPTVTTIDFETLPIGSNGRKPPVPVGVSIKLPGKKSVYWRWGHPDGNNCSFADGKRNLKTAWKGPLLFFNSAFDVDVAEEHMGLRRPPAEDCHDGMFLAFLRNPHARDLRLKPLTEQYLDWPAVEKDALEEWAKKNRGLLLEKFHTKPFKPAAYTGYAPGELAASYAMSDTDRTAALFKDFWGWVINDHGMLEPYRREQKVMPIFMDNSRVGIRVDVAALRRDVPLFRKALAAADAWLRKRLKSPNLNLDADQEVAEALARAGIVREEDWTLTARGDRSVSKVNLTPSMYTDKRVAKAFGYRNRMLTCLRMFMEPWLLQAEERGDGHISTRWNQVRGERGGTRTGRPSTNDPNFLNISKTWGVDDGYLHPDFLDVAELPLVRRYLLPDKGETWLHRDYQGQELRILAHYEDDVLLQAYLDDPWMDVHQFVAEMIEDVTGLTFARKNVKIANFRIIYGGGPPATALGIGCSIDEAKHLLDAHAKALPSIKGRGGVDARCKAIGKAGESIVTWGGRHYYVEPPSYNKKFGRHMTYEYKLLNYQCQGSAADITKQAMINYNEHPKRRGRFLVQVYDEMNASSGPDVKAEMAVLRESMECISEQLDVPLLSEGKTGKTWGDQKKFEEGKSAYE